jgi:tetratricopeptide (TPR) repeat protein
LPLALALVGARAAANPDVPLWSLADRLLSTDNVLNALAAKDRAVDLRSVFLCSYRELGGGAAKAFRLLGLHPGPDVTTAAMASLAGFSQGEAASAMRELADVQLVHEHRPGRYTMHDLLRAYAVERLEDEVSEAERAQSLRRMYDHYVLTGYGAERLLRSYRGRIDLGEHATGVVPEPLANPSAASDWFAAEYQVLVNLLHGRAGPEHDRRRWELAWCMTEQMMVMYRGGDLAEAQTVALQAAERIGADAWAVFSHCHGAAGMLLSGRPDDCRASLDRAMALAEALGQPWAKGLALYAMSSYLGHTGNGEKALAHARRSAAYFREAGDITWENRVLFTVGWQSARLGNFAEARECFAHLRDATHGAGHRLGEGIAYLGLGYTAHLGGAFDEAIGEYDTAIAIFAANDMESNIANVRELLAATRTQMGDHEGARQEREQAKQLYDSYGAAAYAGRVLGLIDIAVGGRL